MSKISLGLEDKARNADLGLDPLPRNEFPRNFLLGEGVAGPFAQKIIS